MGEGDQPVKAGSTQELLEEINSCDGKDVGKQQIYGFMFPIKECSSKILRRCECGNLSMHFA